MENKHTKGEWKLSKDTKGIEVNGKLIVTCWSARNTDETRNDGESWLDMRSRTESERLINNELEPLANAKLIAASPDLLDALQEIVKVFDLENLSNGDVKRIEMANKAINKATK